ncbi:class I SAM-dependent DNA methyltransferase [Herbidospora sp. RD11066]
MPDFLTETRAGYDALVTEYVQLFPEVTEPEAAALARFAEAVPPGPVLEAGSGTGRVTGWLHAKGLDVSGVELSPGMLAVARATHPDIEFAEGDLRSLGRADSSLAGLVAWYSLIHIPPDLHPGVFAEFHRVLRPGGLIIVGFQVGEEIARVRDIDFHRLDPDRVAALLKEAGFEPVARDVREPVGTESTRQGWLMAKR